MNDTHAPQLFWINMEVYEDSSSETYSVSRSDSPSTSFEEWSSDYSQEPSSCISCDFADGSENYKLAKESVYLG